MSQKEVDDRIGISLRVYKAIEVGITRHNPEEMARQIIGCRRKLNMGRKAFARYMGIPLYSLREWEKGRKTVSRKSWERYFIGRL